jgi:hypothetical protein
VWTQRRHLTSSRHSKYIGKSFTHYTLIFKQYNILGVSDSDRAGVFKRQTVQSQFGTHISSRIQAKVRRGLAEDLEACGSL